MPNFSNILNYNLVSKAEYELKLAFNHAHQPRGAQLGGASVGGEFTSTYYPKLDAKGKPIKDHNGKFVHQLDAHGERIPKPPGHVIISEASDSAHDKSTRSDLNATNAPRVGSSRDPAYAEQVRHLIDYAHNLTEDPTASRKQLLASQDQQSTLKQGAKRAPRRKGEVYIESTEKGKPRTNGLDTSTKDCPSEAEAVACLIGQYTRRSTKNFASNQTASADGKSFGDSHSQPDKFIVANFKKSDKFKTTKDLQKALDNHFKNSDIKPAVSKSEDGKGFIVHYQLGNGAATGNAHDQAEQSRVADFNLKNIDSLKDHPKHWNGVEEKIDTRSQVKRLNQFVKKYPNHALSIEWKAATAKPASAKAPRLPKAPKGSRNNPHSTVTTQT